MALQYAVRFRIRHTKSSDIGVGKRVCGMCGLLEDDGTGTQIGFLFGGEVIGQCGEFHFAQVDDAVGTRYDKVNLGPLLFLFLVLCDAPCGSLGGHARNAESLLDLGEMEQAEYLEAEALFISWRRIVSLWPPTKVKSYV